MSTRVYTNTILLAHDTNRVHRRTVQPHLDIVAWRSDTTSLFEQGGEVETRQTLSAELSRDNEGVSGLFLSAGLPTSRHLLDCRQPQPPHISYRLQSKLIATSKPFHFESVPEDCITQAAPYLNETLRLAPTHPLYSIFSFHDLFVTS
ncbi:hypothetical protein CC2G_014641 [Coprinopsis cinerea AmutBmut pab1-1]|nr:hypothetical protein CC2G_014641 [Coprinopsis cinerea AmutBmut pab1-1]